MSSQVIVNKEKRTCRIVDLAIPADYQVKLKERERELAKELKKIMEHESDSDTDCNWCTWNNPQRSDKGTGRLSNQKIREVIRR